MAVMLDRLRLKNATSAVVAASEGKFGRVVRHDRTYTGLPMPSTDEPLIDRAVWPALSWTNAMSVARAARRSVTEPFGGGAPEPSPPAPVLAGANDESSVARLLRLIERIVEVCP